MYPFEKRISTLIKELQDQMKEHGDVWVEATADGCFAGANVIFHPGRPDSKDFRGHSNDDGFEDYVTIGERY